MFVSGGKILAIDKVNVGTGLSGDGVRTPIGLAEPYPEVKYYEVSAGANIGVASAEQGNKVIYTVSATPPEERNPKSSEYIDVAGDLTISLKDAIVNSASSGWNALDTIHKNSGAWVSAKDWTNEILSATSGKLDKSTYDTWSAAVEQSAANISAYIHEQEQYWILSGGADVNVSSQTPARLAITSAKYGENGIQFNLSAAEEVAPVAPYTAGDWIDSDKLAANEIAVSGYTPIYLNPPLYWSVTEVDGKEIHWINCSATDGGGTGAVETLYGVANSPNMADCSTGVTYQNQTFTITKGLADVTINLNYNVHSGQGMDVDEIYKLNLKVNNKTVVEKNWFVGLGNENVNVSLFIPNTSAVSFAPDFEPNFGNYSFTASIFGIYR